MALPFPELLLLLAAIGLVAGVVDAIGGGGGLLTVPSLLALGFTPQQALATNKLQGTFGTGSAAWTFLAAGRVDWPSAWLAAALALAGSVAGGLLVGWVDTRVLSDLIPFLLVGFCVYLLLGIRPRPADRPASPALVLVAIAAVGAYDGVFGPGAGTFYTAAFVGLLGFDLARATAHTKLMNVASNAGALAIFVAGGQVVWAAGLAMAVGQVAGGRIGARLVMRVGPRLVRPVLVVMSLATTAVLIVRDEHNILHRIVVSLLNLG